MITALISYSKQICFFYNYVNKSEETFYKNLQIVGNIIVQEDMYCYIHKDHPRIINQLTEVLLDMEDKGLIKQI